MLQALLIKIARAKAEKWSSEVINFVDGDLHCPALDDRVEIKRDEEGVTHIYAATEHDVYFAQGYTHGSERLWQMELIRRLGSGTLSEVLGKAALPPDRFARVLGWQRLAKTTWEYIDTSVPEVAAAIRSYVEGLNFFLSHQHKKYAVEFKLAGFQPTQWTPLDIITVERVMGFQLSCGFQHKLIRARLIQAVGWERAGIVDYYEPDAPPTCPDGVNFDDVNLQIGDALEAIQSLFDSLDQSESKTPASLRRGQGSNAWAIHGSRTASGKPLLASDPHLKLSLPNIWHMSHLVVEGGLDCTGACIPGFPGIMNGHNEFIAWGITLSYTDVEDVYLEKFQHAGSNKYLVNNEEWRETEVLFEPIKVKGEKEPVMQKVEFTEHGPIISDLYSNFVGDATTYLPTGRKWGDLKGKYNGTQDGDTIIKVALASKTFEPVSLCSVTLYMLNRCRDWQDFSKGCLLMNTPVFNLVYADVHGNIGYWMPGEVPQRNPKHSGMLPVLGWTGDFEWQGDIPKNEMPHELNPKSGFVLSCNHKAIPDSYPHYLGNIWWWGYRAKAAHKYLVKGNNWTVDDCVQLQLSVESIHGREFLKIIRDNEYSPSRLTPVAREAFQLMMKWDCHLTVETVGGCVYQVVLYVMLEHLFSSGISTGFRERRPEWKESEVKEKTHELLEYLKGVSFQKGVKGKNEIGSFTHAMVLRMLDEPDNESNYVAVNWWLQQVGGFDKCLDYCLTKAVKVLHEKFGPHSKSSDWQWGQLHQLHLIHPLSAKLGNKPFDRRDYPIGGDALTLAMATVALDGTYDAAMQAGVSVRQVTDMGDFEQSVWMMPGGQSGHVAATHYNDLTDRFLTGVCAPAHYRPEQVNKHTRHSLLLTPTLTHNMRPLERARTVRNHRPYFTPREFVQLLIALAFVLLALAATLGGPLAETVFL